MKARARILVIDDSTTLRKLVEIALRGTTAEVDFAGSGAEAVQRAIAQPPDVVLLDFLLPDMGGADVCARLAEHLGAAAPPVVVMSAKREGVREAFRAFPFVVDFVAKPFAMEEIRARLDAAMRGAAPQGPARPMAPAIAAAPAIALEQRRGARASADVPAAFLGAVYQRTARFSRKLAGARLSASERKLLALFDGETPVAAILERAGISAEKAASACNRLSAVDLIELRDHASAGSVSGLALWHPGDGDFAGALRALLQRRSPPLELLDLAREDDLAGAIVRARPRLILVTDPASARADQMSGAARAIASALVAVLDTASRAAIDECLAAGFHAVLARPIHLNDLERLLSS